MEIQSPAGASRDGLAGLHSATRAPGGAEESHPAKAPPQDRAPQPRVHGRDYTAGIRLDTRLLGSAVVDEVRAMGATGFAYEHNWGCSARLSSGWRAAAEFFGEPLICQPQISWSFKRR